jgi:hypothetical protein
MANKPTPPLGASAEGVDWQRVICKGLFNSPNRRKKNKYYRLYNLFSFIYSIFAPYRRQNNIITPPLRAPTQPIFSLFFDVCCFTTLKQANKWWRRQTRPPALGMGPYEATVPCVVGATDLPMEVECKATGR